MEDNLELHSLIVLYKVPQCNFVEKRQGAKHEVVIKSVYQLEIAT